MLYEINKQQVGSIDGVNCKKGSIFKIRKHKHSDNKNVSIVFPEMVSRSKVFVSDKNNVLFPKLKNKKLSLYQIIKQQPYLSKKKTSLNQKYSKILSNKHQHSLFTNTQTLHQKTYLPYPLFQLMQLPDHRKRTIFY